MANICHDHFDALVKHEITFEEAAAIKKTCDKCQQVLKDAEAEHTRQYNERKCGYCGATPSDTVDVSMHSGTWECGKCWTWRKLDGPAARHWNKVAKEFVSNVDLYDVQTFFPKRMDIADHEFVRMIELAQKVVQKTDAMIEEHNGRRGQG